jgi:hypothetical protein
LSAAAVDSRRRCPSSLAATARCTAETDRSPSFVQIDHPRRRVLYSSSV